MQLLVSPYPARCFAHKEEAKGTEKPRNQHITTLIIITPVDCSAEYNTTVALNEVAAQAAIALLLLTEETRLRKLLILANVRS